MLDGAFGAPTRFTDFGYACFPDGWIGWGGWGGSMVFICAFFAFILLIRVIFASYINNMNL
jgi:hypothetical protein